uniref:Imidazolonepropionase n=1 Tax=candidate division WOR-3 bacterium TaxID=2052148 RepID=A0A7C3UY86_UNCW3
MALLIKDISQLLTVRENSLGIIEDAFLLIKKGKIASYGERKSLPSLRKVKVVSAENSVVLPGFVDCHTHLVFAGTREKELEARFLGESYKKITEKKEGGILATVEKTRASSFRELLVKAKERIKEGIKWGTTTVEIKSGYGLDTKNELKILRVIKRLQKETEIDIVPTFLGAHFLPPEKKKEDYIREIIEKMLPRIAKEKLAVFCDVFCEKLVFNSSEAERILLAGKRYGLLPKIHADELEPSGGAEVGVKVGAVSCEHLVYPTKKGLRGMAEKKITAVLLPSTALFLGIRSLPPVSEMRRLGIKIALGSDFNPGTSPLNKMPIVIAFATFLYHLTMEEAIIGATLNSARALKLEKRIGSIEKGKDGDVIILKVPDYRFLFYNFGDNPVRTVIKRGKVILVNR